jgi:hypothetical protein
MIARFSAAATRSSSRAKMVLTSNSSTLVRVGSNAQSFWELRRPMLKT